MRDSLRKEAAGRGAGGGDFHVPFWKDAKEYAAHGGDLVTVTEEQIGKNWRRKRLYPSLADGFSYHRAPLSSIAASSARLLSVRRVPSLRGITTVPAASRRRTTSRPNASSEIALRLGLEVCDTIIVRGLFPNAAFQIHNIVCGIKAEQSFGLSQHVIC